MLLCFVAVSSVALLSASLNALALIPTQQVVAGLKALIRNPNITVRQLMQHIPAPDFPTGERFAALGLSEPHQGLQLNRAVFAKLHYALARPVVSRLSVPGSDRIHLTV